MRRRSFTLLEIIIVIIIIGILATLGLVNYQLVIEKAHDQHAKSDLKLIQKAERIYRMEQQVYTPCANTQTANDNLRLALPNPNINPTWRYSVTVTGTGPTGVFSARAVRGATDARWQRTWCITQDTTAEPCCTGSGCSTSPGCAAGCP